MRSNVVIIGGIVLSIALMLATLNPAKISQTKWTSDHGIVTEIYETGLNDLVVKLKGSAKSYYLDISAQDKSIEEIKDKILYKQVVIRYPELWKPLKDQDNRQYISSIQADDEIVFDQE